jgi:DNA-binding NtrC family response regulator
LVKLLDVLIVDDDVEKACSLARLLRSRHFVRIAVGLREAVHAVAYKVPDAIVCALDMPPYRGDALLAMVAREHPEVRRVLYGQGPQVSLARYDAAHAIVDGAHDAAKLLAAIADD